MRDRDLVRDHPVVADIANGEQVAVDVAERVSDPLAVRTDALLHEPRLVHRGDVWRDLAFGEIADGLTKQLLLVGERHRRPRQVVRIGQHFRHEGGHFGLEHVDRTFEVLAGVLDEARHTGQQVSLRIRRDSATAAALATRSRRVGVIATAATVRSHAYFQATFLEEERTRVIIGVYDDVHVERGGDLKLAHKKIRVQRVLERL